jgi:IclR family acetate operon transcriptional repressor
VGEREEALDAIAAPILDASGGLAAILGVQGPSSRFDAARMRSALVPLLEHAAAVSSALGYDKEAR